VIFKTRIHWRDKCPQCARNAHSSIGAGFPSIRRVRAPNLDLGGTSTTTAASNPAWLEFAAGHPAAPAFHHPAWMAVLAASYEQRSGLALRAASRVIRLSPVIAARAIGELFYGHYA
jgi:hypothetical protein